MKCPSPWMEQNISLIFIAFVRGLVVLALYDVHAVSLGNLLAYPSGNVLGRWVEGQNIVEIRVVESVGNQLFDVCEVNHHTVWVQLARLAMYGHKPIVPMQLLALAFIRESEMMAGRYFKSFLYVVHYMGLIGLIRLIGPIGLIGLIRPIGLIGPMSYRIR